MILNRKVFQNMALYFYAFSINFESIDVLGRVKTDTVEKSKIELEPKLEGRQMIMVLAPGK